ncbi:MAG: hypothetical protein IKV16_03355, partial [Clostridia bacterium]|nr:hypothetical protein [Clostridia bacterium]
MNIGNIINFGIYDSKKHSPQLSVSPERLVKTFEFDYIISADKGAFSYTNSKSQPIVPQLIIFRKPGDKSHSKLHFKCYALHFKVEESSPIYEEL